MTQFKEHEVERPQWLGEQWEDASCSGNTMPHALLYLTPEAQHPSPVIEFWVNYAKPEDRDSAYLYQVVFMKDWSDESSHDVDLWNGYDEEQAIVWERAARSAKSMIAQILPRPDLMACRDFSELHNHCDANMLGDAEEVIVEGEAHRDEDYDDPEVSITGWTGEVHDKTITIVDAWIQSRQP